MGLDLWYGQEVWWNIIDWGDLLYIDGLGTVVLTVRVCVCTTVL